MGLINLNLGSGAKIEIKNNKIFKYYDTTNTSLYNQYLWLKEMKNLFPDYLPKIYQWKIVGYEMEYLKNYKKSNEVFTDIIYDKILNIIHLLSTVERQDNKFDTFIDRLNSHILVNIDKFKLFNIIIFNNKKIELFNSKEFLSELNNIKQSYNSYFSNCHGDLTLENIFVLNDSIKLIDSNFMNNEWNSWLLDVGKLLQSFHYNYEDIFYKKQYTNFNYINEQSKITVNFYQKNDLKKYYDIILQKYNNVIKELLLLEISNYLRMLKYKKNQDDYNKAFIILSLLWNNYKENY